MTSSFLQTKAPETSKRAQMHPQRGFAGLKIYIFRTASCSWESMGNQLAGGGNLNQLYFPPSMCFSVAFIIKSSFSMLELKCDFPFERGTRTHSLPSHLVLASATWTLQMNVKWKIRFWDSEPQVSGLANVKMEARVNERYALCLLRNVRINPKLLFVPMQCML